MARNSQLPLGVVYAIITFVPPKGTWPEGKKFPVAPRCGVCHYYFRATKGHVARGQEIPSCPCSAVHNDPVMPVLHRLWRHADCTLLDSIHRHCPQFHQQGGECPADCYRQHELRTDARCALHCCTHARTQYGPHQWQSPEVGAELLLHVHICAPRTDMLFSCSAIGLAG